MKYKKSKFHPKRGPKINSLVKKINRKITFKRLQQFLKLKIDSELEERPGNTYLRTQRYENIALGDKFPLKHIPGLYELST